MTTLGRYCHHWSGWPGAVCLKCGAEDQYEIALADGVLDAYSGQWTDKERKREVEQSTLCSVKGILTWNKTEKKLELTDRGTK